MREIEELTGYLDRENIRGLGKELGWAIQEKLEKSGIYFRIFARMKEAGSICHKLEWKKQEYEEKNKNFRILWESGSFFIIWTIFRSVRNF